MAIIVQIDVLRLSQGRFGSLHCAKVGVQGFMLVVSVQTLLWTG